MEKIRAPVEECQQSVRASLGSVLWRALRSRCPNCGEGQLFASYLKQVERCAVCGQEYGHIRSDDGAPWLTILVVGHIMVPVVLAVETYGSMPEWVALTLWPMLALGLVLAVLPRAKATFLAIIWRTQAPGSERG